MARAMPLTPSAGAYQEGYLEKPQIECQNLWPEAIPGAGIPYGLFNPPGVRLVQTSDDMFGVQNEEIHGLANQDGVFSGDAFIFHESQGVFRTNFPGSQGPGGFLQSNFNTAFDIAGQISTEGFSEFGHVPSAFIRGFMTWVSNYTAYVYDGATTTAVANLPATVMDTAALGKRLLWSDVINDQVYYSDLATGNFNPLNFFTAENQSDRLRAIHVHGDNLYLAGEKTIEIWRPSPDFELPFAYTGVALPYGTLGYGTWADIGTFCAFAGATEDGYGIYQISGASVQKISPNWIDRLFIDMNNRQHIECYAQAWAMEGHTCYEIHFPVHELTLVYDVGSKQWWRFHDNDVANGYGPRFVTNFYGRHYVARKNSGTGGDIGRVRRDELRYFESVPQRVWSVFQPSERRDNTVDIVQQLQVTDETQTRIAPTLSYSHSDDMGRTFGNARNITVHNDRRFGQKAAVRRLGELRQPGRVHRFEANTAANYEIGPMFTNMEVLLNG